MEKVKIYQLEFF